MSKKQENLKQIPKNCKSRLTKFKTFLDKCLNTQFAEIIDIEEIKFRLKNIEETWKEYDKVQTNIELLSPEQDLEEERSEFEDNYFSYSAIAIKIINQRSPQGSVSDPNSQETDFVHRSRIAQLEAELVACRESELSTLRELATSRVSTSRNDSPNQRTHFSLPKLDLPQFSGGYEDWLGFRDTFTALIYNEESIPKIQKLRYLRSYVKGSASQIIDNLETSESNYDVAWNLLQERYNNERIIIQNHMQALFDLQIVSKESSTSLRNLLDSTMRHVRALNVLGQPTSSWDTPLICLIASKLDKESRKEWEKSVIGTEMPKFDQLTKFLRERCQILETLNPESSNQSKMNSLNLKHQNKPQSNSSKGQSAKAFLNTQSNIVCFVCKKEHFIQSCPEFQTMTLSEKFEIAKKKGLCFNCLKRNHLIGNCKAGNCTICKRRHHTLLHSDLRSDSKSEENNQKDNLTHVKNMHIFDASKVLLSTAVVDMIDINGHRHACRILLDNGSQPNIITEDLAMRLKLKKKRLNVLVQVVNNMVTESSEWAVARFKSRNSTYSAKLTFLVLPQITGDIPDLPINKESLKIPNDVILADSEFEIPAKVEALIGAELFFDLLSNGKIPLAAPRTGLQNTKLGWIVTGKFNAFNKKQNKLMCHLVRDPLSVQLENFWKIEELNTEKMLSPEEQACEQHFSSNIQRDDTSGKYILRLPFTERKADLGSSYDAARRRFFALERKLDRDPKLREQYHHFMKEYEELEHMEQVSATTTEGYYIPHHAILKESSITTKLRVVFDASAKTTTGISLNDTLLVGPTIQDGIFELVLRFRQHRIVLCADIEKMYRQFWVHSEDRCYQKILWRYNSKEPLKTYQLNTVTYGTSAAPFLATRCLKQLAQDEGSSFSKAAVVLKNDFYVDDLLTGADTLEDARQLRDELIQLTNKGKLRLCKWVSNSSYLTEDLPDSSNNIRLKIDPDRTTITLGVFWNSAQDTFTFDVHVKPDEGNITKRVILSEIAQLYDPLGLVAPVIVYAKITMQELWKLKLGWDDTVPINIITLWKEYRRTLKLLNSWSVSRAVKIPDASKLHLHGFSDASLKAYGACIYLQSSNEERTQSILLCAKSRVAPVKTTTLPKLELCGALLLAKLYKTVKETLRTKIDQTKFWSDSTIVLNWINSSPHTLNIFEANRVVQIQEITNPADWRYVNTKENPADFVSRGHLPEDFLSNEMWRSGPIWLNRPESEQPDGLFEVKDVPGKKKVSVFVTAITERFDLWDRYSSLKRLLHVVAYCFRFYAKLRKNANHAGPLLVKELQAARKRIVEIVQHEAFEEELVRLARKEELPKRSKIIRLNPILEDDVLKVGGRIKNSDLEYNQKHPILLPKLHPVTDLIVRDIHEEMMHAGINGTLYAIRQNYWIVDGRIVVKRIIHACVKCFRAKPSEPMYVMGNLPKVRITAAHPFENTGIDYCGPFYIKEKAYRNRNKIKVYAAIFVCLTVKAIHIELVGDLTTEAFLGCLRRFFARRGKTKALYSDNATNFVGANRELRALYDLLNSNEHQEKTSNFLVNKGVEWHFIPPRTPHFGGLWEAAVKFFKHHMRRTIGETLFTYEQFYTYMTEIEAILNSRPLTPMSSDPNDLNALTPGHFIIGQTFLTIPTQDLSKIPDNRLSSSWEHLQKLKQDLWKRWYVEYLNEMNVRSKWHTGQSDLIKEGALVVLKEDNVAPFRWALGRIIEVRPGDDGIVRAVKVKTESGVFDRGVKKVSPLPIDV